MSPLWRRQLVALLCVLCASTGALGDNCGFDDAEISEDADVVRTAYTYIDATMPETPLKIVHSVDLEMIAEGAYRVRLVATLGELDTYTLDDPGPLFDVEATVILSSEGWQGATLVSAERKSRQSE